MISQAETTLQKWTKKHTFSHNMHSSAMDKMATLTPTKGGGGVHNKPLELDSNNKQLTM
jgi:hypothetical protein